MYFKYLHEIELLLVFNRKTREPKLYHVPYSTAKRLSAEFAEAEFCEKEFPQLPPLSLGIIEPEKPSK